MGKIKEHFKGHKEAYIVGGACLVVGAGGMYLYASKVRVSQTATNVALVNYRPTNHLEQYVSVHVPARGHRGNIIVDNETGDVYGSERQVASTFNLSRSNLSDHLKGLCDSVGGKTFTKLGENLSEEVKISV